MIYNMLTLTIQLLLIGFAVGVVAHRFFPQGRSRFLPVELLLSILGAFLGTLFEVWVRATWNLPMVYHVIFQFAIPLLVSVATLVLYRLTNSFRD